MLPVVEAENQTRPDGAPRPSSLEEGRRASIPLQLLVFPLKLVVHRTLPMLDKTKGKLARSLAFDLSLITRRRCWYFGRFCFLISYSQHRWGSRRPPPARFVWLKDSSWLSGASCLRTYRTCWCVACPALRKQHEHHNVRTVSVCVDVHVWMRLLWHKIPYSRYPRSHRPNAPLPLALSWCGRASICRFADQRQAYSTEQHILLIGLVDPWRSLKLFQSFDIISNLYRI